MNNVFNPKVSIVIPVYNGERYVKYAIQSALNQTYSNIEVIVINDGSIDNTEEIVKSFGDKIRYFYKDNGGVSTALNLAIKEMKGEYFSWLSHDDLYKADKIEQEIKFLSNCEEKNIILYSDYDLINEKGDFIDNIVKNHDELIEKPEYSILLGAINGITLLIPKKAFDDCGLFDENLYCTQDYDMWSRMFGRYKFIHYPQILASSRIHINQETNKNPKVISEGDKLWIKLIELFDTDTKIKLEGSEYRYYVRMFNYLKNSQYYSTIKYIQKKCEVFKCDKDYNQNDFKLNFTLQKMISKVETFFSLLINNPKKLKTIILSKLK